MFRKMRRDKQSISESECLAVLEKATSGVLALSGDDGYPYAVPLSFVFYDGALYFHCASEGHKLDAINRSDKASFCIIDEDTVVPSKYSTHYRSVIVFGKICVLDDIAEIKHAIDIFTAKYVPDIPHAERLNAIKNGMASMRIIKLTAEHITGKVAAGLLKSKE